MNRFLRTTLLGLPFLFSPSPLLAGDTSLPGELDAVHVGFNAKAIELDLPQRMVLSKCSAEVARTCNYNLTGNLAAIAKSTNEQLDQLESVTLIFAKDSNSTDLLVSMSILIAHYAPAASTKDHGRIIETLIEGVRAGNEESAIVLDGINFKLLKFSTLGLWFIVQTAANAQ